VAGLHTRAGFSELRIGAATGLARYQYYNGRVLNMVASGWKERCLMSHREKPD